MNWLCPPFTGNFIANMSEKQKCSVSCCRKKQTIHDNYVDNYCSFSSVVKLERFTEITYGEILL